MTRRTLASALAAAGNAGRPAGGPIGPPEPAGRDEPARKSGATTPPLREGEDRDGTLLGSERAGPDPASAGFHEPPDFARPDSPRVRPSLADDRTGRGGPCRSPAWEFHCARSTFRRFAGDWDRLNRELCNGHPLFDSRFVGPLLEYFGNGRERLCIHRSDGRVTGALILRPTGLGRWSSFCPAQAQATPVLLAGTELLETLPGAIPGGTWTIELLAVDRRFAPDLSLLSLPWIVRARSETIGIAPRQDFVAYWQSRSRNLVHNVRRYANRAKRESCTLWKSVVVDPDGIDQGVARYGTLETSGWKGLAGTAVNHDNVQGRFYGEVLRRFAATGHGAIHELRTGDRLAASRLVITSESMVVILKTAYDEELKRFAPGRLLLQRLIEDELTRPARRAIEFYTNATHEQKAWATFSSTIVDIQIFRSELAAASFTTLRALCKGLCRRSPPTSREPAAGCVPSIDAFRAQQHDLTAFAAEKSLEGSAEWFELVEREIHPADPGVRHFFLAEDRSPRVILPLRFTSRGPVRRIESLGIGHSSLYGPLLRPDDGVVSLDGLLGAVLDARPAVDEIRLAPMDPHSGSYADLLAALRANDWLPFRFFCFGNRYLKVEGSWDDYLGSRSTRLRNLVRQRSKRFAAAGGELVVARTPEGIEEHIADLERVCASSGKRPELDPGFVRALIDRLARLGLLRLGIARLDRRAIAAQLWVVDQTKASIWQVAHDRSYDFCSPGTVLTAHLLQHVIDCDRVGEVDFRVGDDECKRMWMSDRRERWGIVAYNPRTIVGCSLIARECLARLAAMACRPFSRRRPLRSIAPAGERTVGEPSGKPPDG